MSAELFAFIDDEESLIDVGRIVALLVDEPGTLGGLRIGMTMDELAVMGIDPDDEVFLGTEDGPETPEVPYENDPWPENWQKTVTHGLNVSMDDGAATFISFQVRSWTPMDGWDAAEANTTLSDLRETLLTRLEEALNQNATATGKLTIGDTVVRVKKVRKHEAEVYAPWAAIELVIELYKADD